MHKLDEQKEKYSTELDETLQQNKQLQSQAEAEDQQKIRNDAAAAASARLQQTYGKHYNAQLAREASRMLLHGSANRHNLHPFGSYSSVLKRKRILPPHIRKIHPNDNGKLFVPL
ncbi:MAG: hypothetical protein IJB81_05835 [Clostridia bacterium]|nr:hypothetical protein [Clostridia bacterium]